MICNLYRSVIHHLQTSSVLIQSMERNEPSFSVTQISFELLSFHQAVHWKLMSMDEQGLNILIKLNKRFKEAFLSFDDLLDLKFEFHRASLTNF